MKPYRKGLYGFYGMSTYGKMKYNLGGSLATRRSVRRGAKSPKKAAHTPPDAFATFRWNSREGENTGFGSKPLDVQLGAQNSPLASQGK